MLKRFNFLGWHLVGIAITAVFILPMYLGFMASLRPVGSPPSATVVWWVSDPHWENYLQIFEILPMSRYFLNSCLVVLTAVPITLIIASLTGFAISQLSPSARRLAVILNIVFLMIPSAALWLFRYQILSWLGLLSSLWAIIIPAFAASNPLFVLLFYWSYQRIPTEVYQSARIEGASFWQVWWYIARFLVRPTSMAVMVLTFALYWNDFISPVLYLYDAKSYTLPIGLQILNQLDSTNWPLLMAAAMFMMAPIMLFFLFLQRYFLNEETLSAWH